MRIGGIVHKGIILLVKRETRAGALAATYTFLKEYEGLVWDSYQIGGRWSQKLAPMTKKFKEIARLLLDTDKEHKLQKDVETNMPALVELWKELGGVGNNPYWDTCNIAEEGEFFDIMPLEECIDIVKDYRGNYLKEGLERVEKAKLWLENSYNSPSYYMYGYHLGCAASILKQEFSFECNVYNTEEGNYHIPEDTKGWSAVMIDIHS